MDAEGLKGRVREAYSAAAEAPMGKHPFPVGRQFAASLGYPEEVLDGLPGAAVEAFAGVSNVSVFAEIAQGATVLDLGCGAGLDSLIAAERAGAGGRVVGVDFSGAMLGRARDAAGKMGVRQMVWCRADAERLPLADGAVDMAMVNGLFNLNPKRTAIFGELARVVRPGGRVYAAELIAVERPREGDEVDESNWFA
jgi:SAM-dependent methyltransferase